MTTHFLYDDAVARGFEPYALTRPFAEMRVGALLVRERWARAAGCEPGGALTAPHLTGFTEPGSVPEAMGEIPAGSIVANARCAVPLAPLPAGASAWRCDGRIAALRTPGALDAARFADGTLTLDELVPDGADTVDLPGGRWIDEVWNVVGSLTEQLAEDIPVLGRALRTAEPPEGVRLGAHALYIEDGAHVEPQVCFDLTAGPVLVRRGATVQAFTRIVGPCYVGEGATVMGDRVAASSIGDVCKAHGEMSNTVMVGHANKGHDGFVGHSILGRWVNLGAGTTTSNLKNTYGPVSLWTPTGVRETGLQFLGTLFGDHAKTGIGATLNTGTVVGAGANVYGGGMPPKHVPPFAWGAEAPYAMYRLDKFLEVAATVMGRRHVTLEPGMREALSAAWHRAAEIRETGAPRGGGDGR